MIVGIKSGCFTLYHAGHAWMLNECKRYCDYLIALTNSNYYIFDKKGVVPLSLTERMYILSQHKAVDEVGYFNGPTEDDWIKNFKENTLYQKFGKDAKLTIFHSEELSDSMNTPGEGYADDIIFIPKSTSPWSNSVSKIFEKIRGVDVR